MAQGAVNTRLTMYCYGVPTQLHHWLSPVLDKHNKSTFPTSFHGVLKKLRHPDSHAITMYILTRDSKETVAVAYEYYVVRNFKCIITLTQRQSKQQDCVRTTGISELRLDVLLQI